MLNNANQIILNNVLNSSDMTNEKALVKFCDLKNLEIVKELLINKKYSAWIHTSSNQPLKSACSAGSLEIVDFLLTSKELTQRANMDEDCLMNAVRSGKKELVSYLLTSHKLRKKSNLHAYGNEAFDTACIRDNVELVKYMYCSPELKSHINSKKELVYGLYTASHMGAVNVVRYLLSSEDINPPLVSKGELSFKRFLKNGISELINIHVSNKYLDNLKEDIPSKAFEKAFLAKKIEVIDYLIFEYNITENNFIKELIAKDEDIQFKFNQRDFKEKLSSELHINSNIIKKSTKI